MKNFDNGEYELTKEEISNPDLGSVFISPDGKTMFDRRHDAEFVQKSNVLTPRNADLNLIGAEIVEVPEELQARYRVGVRSSVKQELLRLGLPGVNA